jgi:multisubunit Na+/H+ antiporter MnhB subunit
MDGAFDFLLAALVLAAAAWTVAVRDSFTAVVAFVAYGLLLALVWVRLAAPDVALTEAAVGSGITGGLLISASVRLRGNETRDERPGWTLRACAAVLCAILAAGLAAIVLLAPDPAPSLAPAVAAGLPATTLGNPVAAVLIAFRATDTLLEVIVLVLALLGIWSLAPDRLWGGLPGKKQHADANSPLTLLALVFTPIGIVIGLHIFWNGSQAPGGEFQASAILAAMWILVMIAGLADAPAIGKLWLRGVLVLGPLVFLGIGFLGFLMAGGFLAYPPDFTYPVILLIEAVLMLSIAAMLGLLVAGPPGRSAGR